MVAGNCVPLPDSPGMGQLSVELFSPPNGNGLFTDEQSDELCGVFEKFVYESFTRFVEERRVA